MRVQVSSAYLILKWMGFCINIIYARNILVLTVTTSLKFGKAREIKVSNSSETLYYEHLFLEVRRCVLKMCHVLEHWMKYATLCKVKWGRGLSKGRVCTKCYAIQSGGVCDPACVS
jgi:hypothetical protein